MPEQLFAKFSPLSCRTQCRDNTVDAIIVRRQDSRMVLSTAFVEKVKGIVSDLETYKIGHVRTVS